MLKAETKKIKSALSIENSNIESEDDVLIRDFLNGDSGSFNNLIRKYQKKIYWLVRKMVLDHDDADDITQEVFIKLHGSLKEFRGDSKFFTYVYRIAINFSLNHIKRSSKINNRRVDLIKADLTMNNFIEENIDAKKKSSMLEAAISSLPEQQRAVFNLRYYENLSYEDIANILNRSTGGMKANYFHALKNIGKILKSDRSFKGYEEILDINSK